MARILYGVAGEGMGHAVRSRVVIEHLLKKKHHVKISGAGKAYSYLSHFFPIVETDYFRIIYRNNAASYLLTFFNNVLRFPFIFFKSLRINALIKSFKPDLIITDFDPLVDYYAFFQKIPVISIDNQHLITGADHRQIVKNHSFSFFATKCIINSFIIKKNKQFITTFVPGKSLDDNVFLIKPLLREAIIKAKSTTKNHILVYQTSKSNNKMIEAFQCLPEEHFFIYGFDQSKKIGNVTFKKRDEKIFLEDLRTCKAIITNGGFTLISEALYLKKPILTVPVKSQFEQTLNALHVDLWQYGMYVEELTPNLLKQFLENLAHYGQRLKTYKTYTNHEALGMIDFQIDSLLKERKK